MDRPSPAVAHLLRSRRRTLGLRLRDVEHRTKKRGQVVPISTLSRIERGLIEPGQRRLGLLLELYQVPYQVVGDLIELERIGGEAPREQDPEVLLREGIQAWKTGDTKRGLACLLALQRLDPRGLPSPELRQRALLSLAFAAGTLGKYRLAWEVVQGILIEQPEPGLRIETLVQAAVAWRGLGSLDAALAFVARAEALLDHATDAERGKVLQIKAKLLTLSGQPDAAETALRQAQDLYERAGQTFDRASTFGVLVRIALARGDARSALRAAIDGLEAATAAGFEDLVTQRLLDQGRALIALEKPGEALARLKTALAHAITRDDHETRFYAHYHLWKAYEALGDSKMARPELEASRQFVRFVEEPSPEADAIRTGDGR